MFRWSYHAPCSVKKSGRIIYESRHNRGQLRSVRQERLKTGGLSRLNILISSKCFADKVRVAAVSGRDPSSEQYKPKGLPTGSGGVFTENILPIFYILAVSSEGPTTTIPNLMDCWLIQNFENHIS
ncbi:hypothetical protein AB6A40_010713 [Gnathostoma spinigerum]|uniref:Uncharacterized protein n=1 Tax=Gnathostoma spinigerum TaxID=75299 RepID=A0ABD6F231_9BILA